MHEADRLKRAFVFRDSRLLSGSTASGSSDQQTSGHRGTAPTVPDCDDMVPVRKDIVSVLNVSVLKIYRLGLRSRVS